LKKFNAFAQPELRLRPYLAVEQLAAWMAAPGVAGG
jgi:hypothetical protein